MVEKKATNNGGIWVKEGKNGGKYLSIQIVENGIKKNYVAFENENKVGNQPDYTIRTPRQV